MRSSVRVAFASFCVLVISSGCARRFKPPPVPPPAPQAQSRPSEEGISRYLQAARLGRWVYRRQEVSDHGRSPTRYGRTVTQSRLAEGRLENRRMLPIEEYLQDESTPRPADARSPETPFHDGVGVFFELSRPLEPIPQDLRPGVATIDTAELTYFNRAGHRGSEGRLTRTVVIEGYEDIECPAGQFPQCLRVRLDLEVEFRWGIRINLTSYIWLSEQAGEVRRLQTVSGWFWIIWFESTFEHLLTSYQATPAAVAPPDVPTWSRGAILFLRGVPRPDIGGMVIEFAESAGPETRAAEVRASDER